MGSPMYECDRPPLGALQAMALILGPIARAQFLFSQLNIHSLVIQSKARHTLFQKKQDQEYTYWRCHIYTPFPPLFIHIYIHVEITAVQN